jgi:hypothetical protein
MPVGRCIVLSFAVLLAPGAPASAQVEPGQWVGDLYLIGDARTSAYPWGSVFINETDDILESIPHISKSTNSQIPYEDRIWSFQSCWHNDALYTLACGWKRQTEAGTESKCHILAKWEEDEWHSLGEYETDAATLLRIIPCDDDRFIVISNKDLTGNKNISQWSPFHRMTLIAEQKKLRLDTAIDYGMDDIRDYMPDPDCFSMIYNSRIALTKDYAVVINGNTGLYWILSLEKATMRHSGNIFRSITPEMIAKGGFPSAILRMHPEHNGTILISAQEESAFLTETGNVFKEIQELLDKNPDLSLEDVKKMIQLRQRELADRNPLLVWYRIDPEKGKAEKLEAPPTGAAYVRDSENGDNWRPMPDGSVRMGSLDSFLVDDGKQQESKQASAANEKRQEKSDEPQKKDDGKLQEKSEKPSNSNVQQAAAPEPPK